MQRKIPIMINGKNTIAPIAAPAIQKGTAHDAIIREAMPSSIFLIDFIKNFSFYYSKYVIWSFVRSAFAPRISIM